MAVRFWFPFPTILARSHSSLPPANFSIYIYIFNCLSACLPLQLLLLSLPLPLNGDDDDDLWGRERRQCGGDAADDDERQWQKLNSNKWWNHTNFPSEGIANTDSSELVKFSELEFQFCFEL